MNPVNDTTSNTISNPMGFRAGVPANQVLGVTSDPTADFEALRQRADQQQKLAGQNVGANQSASVDQASAAGAQHVGQQRGFKLNQGDEARAFEVRREAERSFDLPLRKESYAIGEYKPTLDTRNLGVSEEELLREKINEFVSVAFVQPLLKMSRDGAEKGGMFHGGYGEDVFGSQVDQSFSDMITKSNGFGLVDTIMAQITGDTQALVKGLNTLA